VSGLGSALRRRGEYRSCETRLTSIPSIAARSSERSAKGYGRHSKKIKNCRQTLECDSNDSANQKAEPSVRLKHRDQDTTYSAAVAKKIVAFVAFYGGSNLWNAMDQTE
jgi:hypothetical protein